MKFDRKYALSQIRIACGEMRRNLGLTIAEVTGSRRAGETEVSSRDIGRIENGSADLVDEKVFRRVLLVLDIEGEDFEKLVHLHKIAKGNLVVFRWKDLPRRRHKVRRENAHSVLR